MGWERCSGCVAVEDAHTCLKGNKKHYTLLCIVKKLSYYMNIFSVNKQEKNEKVNETWIDGYKSCG